MNNAIETTQDPSEKARPENLFQIYNPNTESYILTTQIQKRLKKLQKDLGYTSRDITFHIDCTLDAYKNIINESAKSKQRNITQKMVQKLSDLYSCSPDYILCSSDDPAKKGDGAPLIHPIVTKDYNIIKAETFSYLSSPNAYGLLKDLHFLLFEFPKDRRNKLIDSFKTIISTLREDTYYGGIDYQISPTSARILKKTFLVDDKAYYEFTIQLSEAKNYQNEHKYKKSFLRYLDILNNGGPYYKDIMSEACDGVLKLKEQWRDFPHLFDEYINYLFDYKSQSFLRIAEEYKEYKELINNYMAENGYVSKLYEYSTQKE